MRLAAFILCLLAAQPGWAQCTKGDGDWVREACYDAPRTTGLYGHDVLGGTPEWSEMVVTLGAKGRATLTHHQGRVRLRQRDNHIFEDIAPRIDQLDGEGPPELIMVDTAFDVGARLLVLNLGTERLASTPYIGRSFRWLAPLGAADLDGDGRVELAYVDRPHLAKTLVVWRYDAGQLSFVADRAGLTNHRIGQAFISGGIRDCGEGPEIITADGTWSRVMATRLSRAGLQSQAIGDFAGPQSFAAALACEG